MRKFLPFALATALMLPVAAFAQTGAPATITVTGEGVVQTVPDQATLSLGVTTSGATAAEAMAANSTAMTAVIARLKAAGIAEADMQTANLYLSPNWGGYDSGSSPSIVDYTVSNSVNVLLRDISGLGATLDAAVADGANAVNGITFGLADQTQAMNEARTRAVTDARARAEVLAAAAGVELGALISISDNGAYPGPAPMFRADATESAAPVETGELALMSSVMVTWAIAE